MQKICLLKICLKYGNHSKIDNLYYIIITMPIMTMHDVRKDKTYDSEKWLTLEELAKEAWVPYPKEPSFEASEAVEKKEAEPEAPKKRWRKKKEEFLEDEDDE